MKLREVTNSWDAPDIVNGFGLKLETLIVKYLREQKFTNLTLDKNFEVSVDDVGGNVGPSDRPLTFATFEVKMTGKSAKELTGHDYIEIDRAFPKDTRIDGERVLLIWRTIKPKKKKFLYDLHAKGSSLKGHEEHGREYLLRFIVKMMYEDRKYEMQLRRQHKLTSYRGFE